MAPRSLNKVLLMGNLGKDPELRYTSWGKAVATFSLATSQQWRDQDGKDQERTEWHRVVAWGRLGEICGEYLSKGKQVFIEGRIQSREWEDQEGKKRTTVEIIANDLIMLGGSGQSQNRVPNEGQKRQSSGQSREPAQAPKPQDEGYHPLPPEDGFPF